jgi:hypothetical protein
MAFGDATCTTFTAGVGEQLVHRGIGAVDAQLAGALRPAVMRPA